MFDLIYEWLLWARLYYNYLASLRRTLVLQNFIPRSRQKKYYNNRQHDVLGGLTPMEVLNGKIIDKDLQHLQIQTAGNARIAKNKEQKCCSNSFLKLCKLKIPGFVKIFLFGLFSFTANIL